MKGSVQKALARSTMYKLLSDGLGYPDKGFQKDLQDGSFLKRLGWTAEKLSSYKLDGDIKALGAVISKRSCDAFFNLASDHSRLFGIEQKGKCSPYELEYLPGPLFLKTHKLADIAGFYSAFGLEVGGKNKDRVDHVCVELEFMSFLALKEAYALSSDNGENVEICRDAQRKFLQDHLGRWVGALSEQINESRGSEFYATLGRLLNKFVPHDSRMLGVNPEIIRHRFHFQKDVNSPGGGI
jgi:DMSO reductase family type II enzyme chaperone